MNYIGIHFGCLSIRIYDFVYLKEGKQGEEIKIKRPFGLDELYTYFQGTFPNAYDPNTKSVGYKAIKQVGIKGVKRFDKEFFQGLSLNNGISERHIIIWRNFIKELFKNYKIGDFRNPIKITIYLEDIDLSIERRKGVVWRGRDDYSGQVFNLMNDSWRKFRLDDVEFITNKEKVKIVRSFIENNQQINQNDSIAIIGDKNTSIYKFDDENPKVRISCGSGINNLIKNCCNLDEHNIYQIIHLCNQEGNQISEVCMKNLQIWKNQLLPQMNSALRNICDFGKSNTVWIGGEGANLWNSVGKSTHININRFYKLPDPLLVHAIGASLHQAHNANSKENK